MKLWIIVALIAAIVGALACTAALASPPEMEQRANVPQESPEPEVEEPEATEPDQENAPREPTECPDATEDEQPAESEPEEEAEAPDGAAENGPPTDQLSGTAVKVRLHCTEEVLDDEEAYQVAGVQTKSGEQLYLFLYRESEEGQIDLIVEGLCEVHRVWWMDGSGCWQSKDVSERASEEDSEDMNYFFCVPEDVVFGDAEVWIDCSESSPDP